MRHIIYSVYESAKRFPENSKSQPVEFLKVKSNEKFKWRLTESEVILTNRI